MTMLDGMRRHKGWLKWSLAVVVLAFIFLIPGIGLGPMGDADLPTNVLVRVGEHEITVAEFRQIYQQQVQSYRLQAGSELSDDVLRQLGIDRQLLQQLIDEFTALVEAERLGLEVTNAEVRERIVSIPGLQENGQFIGETRYRQFLQMQRPPLSTGEFEENIRQSILIERLRAGVTEWVSVSNQEVDEEHRRRNERVRVDVIAFRGDDYREEVVVTDTDIEEFFEAHPMGYQVPEKRKLRFLLIDQAELANAITPTETEIVDYYESNSSRYSTPGQVRASHILLRAGEENEEAVKARAQELADQARQGSDFSALAREHSEDEASAVDGGDVGLFERGRMVPEFEAAAFALEENTISDPVRSAFGFHVIKVTEKQEESTELLDDVRDSIIETLREERATGRANSLSRAIQAEVSTPSDLDAAASSRGLEVQESAFASRGEPILGLGLASAVSARAFELGESEIAGPIDTPLGPAFVTVVDRQDPYVPPLDEVKEQVREDVLRSMALALAQERATQFVVDLRAAEDFVVAAEAEELVVASSELLTRGGTFPEVGANAVIESVAFSLPVGGVSDVIETGNLAAILHVSERQEVTNQELDNAREDLRTELLQRRQSQFYRSYLNKASATLQVDIDQEAFELATGA